MTGLMVVLTVLEVLLVVAALAGYLVAITRSLRRTAVLLGRVAFGVRAIERQCETIGATVPTINASLGSVSEALADLSAAAASRPASGTGR